MALIECTRAATNLVGVWILKLMFSLMIFSMCGCALLGVLFTLRYCDLPAACGVSGHIIYSTQYGGLNELSRHGDGPWLLGSSDTAIGFAFFNSMDGLRLCIATDEGVDVFGGYSTNEIPLAQIQLAECGGGQDVDVFDDGTAVVSCADPPKLIKIDLATSSIVGGFSCCEGEQLPSSFLAVAISPDEKILSGVDFIGMFDGLTGEYLGEAVPAGVGGATQYNDFVFGPDGRFFVSAGPAVGVLEFDGGTFELSRIIGSLDSDLIGTPTGLTITEEGHLLVGTGANQSILRYDLDSGELLEVVHRGDFSVNFIGIRP